MFKLSRVIPSLVAFCLSFVTMGCVTPQAVAESTANGPALWEVSDDDTTIYLFGTVHALPTDVDWFRGPIKTAFDSSDELVTEIALNDTSGMQKLILEKGMLPKGQNLRDMMTPENRIQYEEAMVSLGVPVEAFDHFKPWYAAMTLQVLPILHSGYMQDSGVENVLSGQGTTKKMAALETAEQQLDLFDSLPMQQQLTYLDQTVETASQIVPTIDEMVAEWLAGDADDLAKLLNSEMTDPALYKRLLTNRNAHWADWIAHRMKQPGTVFLAVGAGHLAGKGSVQDQLKKRGIKARRINE
ncbi:TraB/GumN family protein [Altererythrobacter indicus]|uniref:TraB/GumN family protein n=1 Tax=Altericroceibacterium indicum TaxID=374177 RepID=A0A845ADH5_9SPHN|nr:TraB/GumN family protein [Altericroceibacterium indicum]MXP25238.1 TraB/GumN family protein [Altericroceibacterium indicum]